jgi:hypothetical protein
MANLASQCADAALPPWHEVGSLSLAAIYAELSRLDALDRDISSQRKDTEDAEDAEDADSETGIESGNRDAEKPAQEAPPTGAQQIDQRRTVLRARAMELSRNRAHSIGILDLPSDVLRDIFDFVEGPSFQNDRKSVIQSARQVCHVFHKIASRLLCSQLRIRLDKESLASAGKLLENDIIASGVRDIKVGLDYRPKELATDLARFVALRKADLEKMQSRCNYYHETWYLGGHDEKEDICPQPFEEYDTALKNGYTIRRAWTEYLDSGATKGGDQDIIDYQKILLESHTEYRRLHEEQLHLIEDGSFAVTIAKLLSRLPRMASLIFVDESRPGDDSQLHNNETLYLNNKEKLGRFMVMADDWSTIEQLPGGAELTPARLLSDLPIACHKAGITLRQMSIECFPVRNNYSMVRPSSSWEDLGAACRALEVFKFGGGGMNCKPIRKEHIQPTERAHIDAYLRVMTSGKDLNEIGIAMYVFGLNDGQTDQKDWYPLDPVFTNPDWPRLRRLRLSSVALSEAVLSRVCTGMGDNLIQVQLSMVDVSVGGWAAILDILREKIGAKCKTNQCKFHLAVPAGKEFGRKEPKVRDPFAWMDTKSTAWASLWQEPLLVVQARKYVACNDEVTKNPLRTDETVLLQTREVMVEMT